MPTSLLRGSSFGSVVTGIAQALSEFQNTCLIIVQPESGGRKGESTKEVPIFLRCSHFEPDYDNGIRL
jgi:hypothetical protein